MKKGLILEGGAMREMFTCGVLDVFMENGIEFDGAVGISAGAVFGCNIKSRQIGRAIRYSKMYCKDPRFGSFKSLLMTGDVFDVDFCYNELPKKIDRFDTKAFASNPMEFYVGATDMTTGKCVFHKCENGDDYDMLWMRASASLPLVSKPVMIDDKPYLDGGISDSVPFSFLKSKGYDRNVMILTQPKGYYKKKSSHSMLYKLKLHKYPKLLEALLSRYKMYNKQMDEINELEKSDDMLIIRPKEALGITRMESNPDELERVYQLGVSQGNEILPKVKDFFNIKS